ncbi:MAG: MarR family transcriptional regulator [Magnetospirillum sp.]|nr:MarR family transcriptional regulator [Magnetospirillum sp.]
MLLEHVARMVQVACFTDKLPPVQWSALRYLARADTVDRSIGGLSAFSGVNRSSASRTIAALAKKGLITAELHDKGRRNRKVELTSAGWRMLDDDPLEALAHHLASLPEDRLTVLHGTLEFLRTKLRVTKTPRARVSAPGAGRLPQEPN